jgi:hypothetical protein
LLLREILAWFDERAYPQGSGSEERQGTGPKEPQPEGFRRKRPRGFVVPQSKTHEGYFPSSRLVGGPFWAKQQYPESFNGLLAVCFINPHTFVPPHLSMFHPPTGSRHLTNIGEESLLIRENMC